MKVKKNNERNHILWVRSVPHATTFHVIEWVRGALHSVHIRYVTGLHKVTISTIRIVDPI